MSGAGGGGAWTLVPGLRAEIDRVVKVLTSRMPRPTKSTSYRIEKEREKHNRSETMNKPFFK